MGARLGYTKKLFPLPKPSYNPALTFKVQNHLPIIIIRYRQFLTKFIRDHLESGALRDPWGPINTRINIGKTTFIEVGRYKVT